MVNELKMKVANAVFEMLNPNDVIGIGAGSTVKCLVDLIIEKQFSCKELVVACPDLTMQLQEKGFEITTTNSVRHIDLYVDGADQIIESRCCLKGGGGRQTMEKLLANMAKSFIVMVDESKWSNRLGKDVPVSIEVLPEARSYVARQCVLLGGQPVYRQGYKTMHNNDIIDVYDLPLAEPLALEDKLNGIIGVVGHGLFAYCRPNKVFISMGDCIRRLHTEIDRGKN